MKREMFEVMIDEPKPNGFSDRFHITKKMLIGIGVGVALVIVVIIIICAAVSSEEKNEEKKIVYLPPIYECLIKGDLDFTEEDHRNLARKSATEGMVLAQNNGLPIKTTDKVVLFGSGTVNTYYGGGGSAEMFVGGQQIKVKAIQVLEGMENKSKEGKFIYEKNEKEYTYGNNLTEADIQSFSNKGSAKRSVAVFTISRWAREAIDRNQDSELMGTMLTDNEIQTYNLLLKYFDQVVVVLNVPSVMEISYMVNNPKTSILIAFFPGVEAGNAIADVLVGDENPSGHLSDTWAKLDDYPSTKTFKEYQFTAKHMESLFVGYRYFELDAEKQSKVIFPFGFGLSYTTFSLSSKCSFNKDKEEFTCTATVKNTGAMKGKQVVQVYAQKPQNENFVKAPRELVAFAKTQELSPGQSQELKMNFYLKDLASYDETGALGNISCYVLEAGSYNIYVGTSVADTRSDNSLKYTYKLEQNKITQQLTTRLKPTDEEVANANKMPDFNSFMSDKKIEDKSSLTSEEENILLNSNKRLEENEDLKLWYEAYFPTDKINKINFKSVLNGEYKIEDLLNAMSNEQLVKLFSGRDEGKVMWDVGIIGGDYNVGPLAEFLIPGGSTNDGGAGLKHTEYTLNSTAWPCSTLLASTFNLGLMYKIGEETGKEGRRMGGTYWLAPGMNIHRNPLCGRNFEYYSEDPLLSGKMGAEIIKGFQSKCLSATIKHMALNNREDSRGNMDSRVAERVAREIYLKPFEIAVKEARPWAIMSSYNKINGIHTSVNKDLLTGIIREEWGYEGLIMTDWSCGTDIVEELKAGGNVKMNTGNTNQVLEALNDGTLAKETLIKAGYYILNSLANTTAAQKLLFDPKIVDVTNGAKINFFENLYSRHFLLFYGPIRDEGYYFYQVRDNTWLSVYIKNDKEGKRKARIKYSAMDQTFGLEVRKYDLSLGQILDIPSTEVWGIFRYSDYFTINLPKGIYELTFRFISKDQETNVANVFDFEIENIEP